MLNNIKISNIFFLDIETVSQFPNYDILNNNTKRLWSDKIKYFAEKENKSPSELYHKAGIYAEFGKIICISVGIIFEKDSKKLFRIKSFYGNNENDILNEFNELLNKLFISDKYYLCAHNGKEFDFPYIARRTLINNLKLPKALDIAGKKPWEVKHLDTLDLWKFGDYKHYTSLDLLTSIFKITSPKDDIKGSDVGNVYWKDNDIDRIVKYCQKDVLAIAQIILRYKGEELIKNYNVTIV